MKSVVISQPMFFPWVGLFEQIRLADIYVHYDDVAYSKGSLINRVQIKTQKGYKWLTIPLKKISIGDLICNIEVDDNNWKNKHISFLKQTYTKAPFVNDMLDLVNQVYTKQETLLCSYLVAGLNLICEYFGFHNNTKFIFASELNINGKSSKRVFDIVKFLNGKNYITGHGAKKYLDHDLFDNGGISVNYMEYQCKPYHQLYGTFTPFVSILDLIANKGENGINYIDSGTVNWREFNK